jgi:DNA-binding MarR family transcriptional regulator
MQNNYSLIIANPFKNLTKSQIRIYYFLSSIIAPDSPITEIQNKDIALALTIAPETASRGIKKLKKEGFISTEYIPNGYGTIRRILVNKL